MKKFVFLGTHLGKTYGFEIAKTMLSFVYRYWGVGQYSTVGKCRYSSKKRNDTAMKKLYTLQYVSTFQGCTLTENMERAQLFHKAASLSLILLP